jgi:transposase-like protein
MAMTEWRKHLAAQAQSGVTAAEYCRRHGLVISQFLYWRVKLKAIKSGEFVPVGESTESSFELTVNDQIRVKIPRDFEAAALKRLLEVVGA